MLKILCAGCRGVFPAISAQFTFNLCVATWNRKNYQIFYFRSLRSFKVVDVDTLKACHQCLLW